MITEPRVPFLAADRLLSFLRDALHVPSLAYARMPVHIPGGSGVRVHGFRLDTKPYDEPLVVRILPDADRADDTASLEACVQNTLAGLGYPAPKVLAACDDPTLLQGAFSVMQWVAGEPLLRVGNNANSDVDSSFLSQVLPDLGRLLFRDWPGDLAVLHARLHDLEVGVLEDALQNRGIDPARIGIAAELERIAMRIETHDFPGLRPALDWLERNVPTDGARRAICHGDFFPNQVFGTRGCYSVLDWSDVILAPPEVDVGVVECGLVTAPVELPGPLDRLGSAVQSWLARRFVATYEGLRPCDLDHRRYGQVLRGVRTLVAVGVRRRIVAGTHPGTVAPLPFDSPMGVQRMVSYLEVVAGVRVELPGTQR